MKFRRNYDLKYKGSPYKNKSGKSMTQPSMTLTVKELMERHTRGLETGVEAKEELYLEEEVPRITDLTDLVYKREHLLEEAEELTKKINDEKAERERIKRAEEEKSNTDTPQQHKTNEDNLSQKSKETKE